MVKRVVAGVVFAVLVAACGGGHKSSTAPAEGTESGGESSGNENDGNMVPPEKMDEIVRLLDRKRTIVSRCLSVAIDNKELPKNSRGKVTLALTIAPSGKTSEIKVVSSTIESASLGECVMGHVREIQFPTLPKPYPTSYTYAFEAG